MSSPPSVVHRFEQWQGDEGLGASVPKGLPLPKVESDGPRADGKYEVIVSGAGPSGLFLTMMLARLGVDDTSLLCLDGKPHRTVSGHGDGLGSRTLEILSTVGLEGDVLRYGNKFTTGTWWGYLPEEPDKLVCLNHRHVIFAPARYPDVITLDQGWIERILLEEYSKYTQHGVQYSSVLLRAKLDEQSDPDYPIVVTVKRGDKVKVVRTKYLVGADGARSAVRSSLGIKQDEWSANRIWGVIDVVAESDFPDIRRQVQLPGKLGDYRKSAYIIPRGRFSNGDWVTRFYADMTDDDSPGTDSADVEGRKVLKSQITPEGILEEARCHLSPYTFELKKGTKPQWWAAYSFSQRLALSFDVRDKANHPRAFLIGDAAHTHSPNQGQGMNTGIQDAYNLSWKLAYALHNLTPDSSALLDTYQAERLPNARRILDNDRRWNATDMDPLERYEEMRQVVTMCGIEYTDNLLVHHQPPNPTSEFPVTGTAFIDGILRTGRRLLNVEVQRYADDTEWNIHDDLPSTGRYRILVVCSGDLLTPSGRSAQALTQVCGHIIPTFLESMIELIVLFPESVPKFDWKETPAGLKALAEMRLFRASKEVYATYGVDEAKGAAVLIRPDGVVAMIAALEDVKEIDSVLSLVLRKKPSEMEFDT